MKSLLLGLRVLMVAAFMLLAPNFPSAGVACAQVSSSDIFAGMGISEEREVSVGDEFLVDMGKQVFYKTNNHDATDLVQGSDGKYKVLFTKPGEAVISCIFPNKSNDGSISMEVMNILFHIRANNADQTSYVASGQVDNNGPAPNANFAQEILAMVNKERAKVGLHPLVLDYELMEGCKIRAKELTKSYSHTRPDGRTCFTVIGYHNAYKGENIAAGYANSVEAMEGWMNSPGHRGNILDRNYVKLGVGYYNDPEAPYRHFWVQMFLGRDV